MNMSFLSSLFVFGKKKERIPTTQEALQKLRDTEEMLHKKSEYLSMKIEEQERLAKQHGMANKRAAIQVHSSSFLLTLLPYLHSQALKRKKQYEKQMQQNDGVLDTIMAQVTAYESSALNAHVLDTIGTAVKAQKQAHGMDVDEVCYY